MPGPEDTSTSPTAPTQRRALWLLGLGAIAGLVVAATGLLEPARAPAGSLPDGFVARVGDTLIARADFERLVAGLESDTRQPADAATRLRLLDRMIDEELLVQRGLALGLAKRDRKIRGELTAAMIRSIVVEAEADEPSLGDLEAFFADERALFTRPGRLHVEQIFFRVRSPDEAESALARALAARERVLSGEDFARVREDTGDPVISPIPAGPLPAVKLREYIGPTALEAALGQETGLAGAPVRSGVGYHVLRVVDREPAETPAFESVRELVRAEYQRRAGDAALRDYLDDLRDRAEIVNTLP